MKTVYQTDHFGVFVGATLADESPMEPGVWLIPAGCVEVPPPEVGPNEVPVWGPQGWTVMVPQPPTEGGEAVPPKTPEEVLEEERAAMSLSFAQFVVGLVEQQWVSPQEGSAWLSGSALPAAVEAALGTIPETAEGGSMPRLRARARALRPSEVQRNNELLLLMASMQNASPEDLDGFFRSYAAI